MRLFRELKIVYLLPVLCCCSASCHRSVLFSQEISRSSPEVDLGCADICLSRCSPDSACISSSISCALISHVGLLIDIKCVFRPRRDRLRSSLSHIYVSSHQISICEAQVLDGGVASCHHLLQGGGCKKWKESLEIGQIISCVCRAAQEQKVGVNHGGGATPFGMCPR